MSRKDSHLHTLVRDQLASPSTDAGIRNFGREAVENIEKSVIATGLIASSLADSHSADPVEEPYELILSDEVNPTEAAIWMGKVIVRDYGMDFAIAHMAISSASEKSTTYAIEELERGAERGYFGYVFMVEHGDLTKAQEKRARQIRGHIPPRLAVMRLLPTTEMEIGLETTPERQPTVGPEFTIDDRLDYPLILRRTIEPEQPSV